ncbi:protein kinase, partial [Trypanosoma cruzi]
FMHESTKVGSGRGTLYYKSPEQLMGRAEDYFACDMWALGCTLFELSTGSVAFCGSTDLQVLHQIYAKLGTDFQFYPEKIRETTLFDSLSAPSTAFLELLKGLLALDPKKRLTASEALKHPFFDPIRHKYGVDSENMEVTFPLRPRCCRPVDTTRFTFRPVCSTPAKRSQRAIAGVFSRVKCGLNLSDPNLSCSGRRCSVWSSSFSG